MGRSIQYMVNNNGVYTTQQFQLFTEDLELATGVTANYICSCKGSDDTIYLLCGMNEEVNRFGKIIKITNTGTTTISQFGNNDNVTSVSLYNLHNPSRISLNRQEDYLFIWTRIIQNGDGSNILIKIPVVDLTNDTIQVVDYIVNRNLYKFQLYRDIYIWGIGNSIVNLYNQSIPYSLVSSISIVGSSTMVIDINNQFWTAISRYYNGYDRVVKISYDGSILNIYTTNLTSAIDFQYIKQSLIDKWGDLILITNDGSTSALIKINLTGTPAIIDTIDLVGVRYNLNTDKDGAYFYSNNLNTWKIPANTVKGQVFSATKTIIRGTGMTTYDNDITGYMVSSNSSVGC